MIAYKGFHSGLVCRGYQFVMGLNVTEQANCAADGFHCAEDPLDCLTYYSNMEHSEYCLVNAGGDVDEDGSDSNISCTELTILKSWTWRNSSFTLWRIWRITRDVNGTVAFRKTRHAQDMASRSFAALTRLLPAKRAMSWLSLRSRPMAGVSSRSL